MEKGTGRGARAVLPANLVVAGKSGTSSDYRDNWFAGFSGSHLAVVWVGYDDNLPTGFTGSSGALPVWARMMAGLGTTSWDAPMPESLAETWIDYGSGLRVAPGCAEDIVAVAVPAGLSRPPSPAAGSRWRRPPASNPVNTLIDSAQARPPTHRPSYDVRDVKEAAEPAALSEPPGRHRGFGDRA